MSAVAQDCNPASLDAIQEKKTALQTQPKKTEAEPDAHTSFSLALALCVCSFSVHRVAADREEQRLDSVKHRYYLLAFLILHDESIAEITTQLLPLF